MLCIVLWWQPLRQAFDSYRLPSAFLLEHHGGSFDRLLEDAKIWFAQTQAGEYDEAAARGKLEAGTQDSDGQIHAAFFSLPEVSSAQWPLSLQRFVRLGFNEDCCLYIFVEGF